MTTESTPHPWIAEVVRELARARRLHPSPDHMALAMAEESGEVIKAILDLHQRKPGATWDAVHQECIQTIVTAVRLLEEGDPTLIPYAPTEG